MGSEHGASRGRPKGPNGSAARPRSGPLTDGELDAAALGWGDALDLSERREIERRIAEAVRDDLSERVRGELRRYPGALAPSVEDAVHQTVVELPAILDAYLLSARSGARRAGGFRSYLMSAARNVACDLAKGSLRERDHLARLSRSHPSRLGRVPTTPSQVGMRSEVRDLLAAELARLEDVDRRILERRGERADFAEIGRELGMPRETVRDRYHACAGKLRRVVERALGGDPFATP